MITEGGVLALALYNYGCFTTMVVEDGRVRGFGMHLDRLRQDAAVLSGDAARLEVEDVRELVREAVAACGERRTVVRVTVFPADFDISRPEWRCRPSVLVTARRAPTGRPGGLRARSTRFTRDLPQVKHVGLFGQLHQRRLARLAGFDDALFVDRQGQLTEGATWNIGFADGERLVWPSSNEALAGVTMRGLRSVAQRAGLPSVELPLTLASVAAMPAAFATSAVVGVRPVVAIDDQEFVDAAGLVPQLAELHEAQAGEPL